MIKQEEQKEQEIIKALEAGEKSGFVDDFDPKEYLNPKYALALANCIFDKENQSFSAHFDWLSTGASLH